MTPEEQKLNRAQLKQCFIDLGMRAKETNEPYIQNVCFVLAGAIAEGSDPSLALWVSEFAMLRIDQMKKDLEEGS